MLIRKLIPVSSVAVKTDKRAKTQEETADAIQACGPRSDSAVRFPDEADSLAMVQWNHEGVEELDVPGPVGAREGIKLECVLAHCSCPPL
mgnify:FL=1